MGNVAHRSITEKYTAMARAYRWIGTNLLTLLTINGSKIIEFPSLKDNKFQDASNRYKQIY